MPLSTTTDNFIMMSAQLKFLTHTLVAITVFVLFNTPTFAEPPNLSALKKDIQTYHDSGLYQKELHEVVTQAHNFILEKAALNEQRTQPKKLAVVLDIDETSLSNYNNIVKNEFSGNREMIHQDILKATTPAIKETLELYNDLKKHHIAIFFVTGRDQHERQATELNLKRAGYHDWDGMYLRPSLYHEQSIISFKSNARADINKKGFIIIASIGDQYSDLIGGHALKGFKLPNPFYYLP